MLGGAGVWFTLSTMKISLIQLNPTVGAVEENAALITRLAREAAAAGAEVVVFPELALCGYPPDDLVLYPRFMDAVMAAVEELERELPPEALVILGAPWHDNETVFNSALLFSGGRRVGSAHKMRLAHYGIFDERRLFKPGRQPCVHTHKGVRLAIHIGEDTWDIRGTTFFGLPGHCDVLINLAAAPFRRGGAERRLEMVREAATSLHVPVLLADQVGGQDELVFDGIGLAVNADGTLAARSTPFQEGILTIELTEGKGGWQAALGEVADPAGELEEVYEALKVGLRDYVNKNGFPGVLVALSGGIDSALVAAIAVDALGRERVRGITLPSAITSEETLADALELARRLEIPCVKVPIAPAVDALAAMVRLADGQTRWGEPVPGNMMEENLAARVRGVMVMALSNRYGHMVVTTGNKSEMATGYVTLYGDMAGGFALLKDVPKTLVFALSRWRNERGEVIPPSTIARPPSAELKPGQLDTDSLPPYDILDPIIEQYIEQQARVQDILSGDAEADVVRRVIRMVDRSEYKRQQSAPGVRITPKAFGRDRRMPITNGFGG